VNSKWPKLMLMSGITSAWLLYEMATATEAPGRALAILQYGLLACALIGLIGLLVMLASGKMTAGVRSRFFEPSSHSIS
jgi:hypothetical protein